MNPMNAPERAEKIHFEIHGPHAHSMQERCLEFIAAQITEAEREAMNLGHCEIHGIKRGIVCTVCVVDAAYQNGFRAARAKAAGVADSYCIYGDNCKTGEIDCRACKSAKAIRAMEPDK